MHPYFFEMFAKQYTQERLTEARRRHLVKSAQRKKPHLKKRILTTCGDMLIHWGCKLKIRYGDVCKSSN